MQTRTFWTSQRTFRSSDLSKDPRWRLFRKTSEIHQQNWTFLNPTTTTGAVFHFWANERNQQWYRLRMTKVRDPRRLSIIIGLNSSARRVAIGIRPRQIEANLKPKSPSLPRTKILRRISHLIRMSASEAKPHSRCPQHILSLTFQGWGSTSTVADLEGLLLPARTTYKVKLTCLISKSISLIKPVAIQLPKEGFWGRQAQWMLDWGKWSNCKRGQNLHHKCVGPWRWTRCRTWSWSKTNKLMSKMKGLTNVPRTGRKSS